MSTVTPGWYKDPADPTTQRYWDGEGWIGDPLPADAQPPPGPPPVAVPVAAAPDRGSAAPAEAHPSAAPPPPPPPPPPAPAPAPARPAPPGWPPGYPHPYPRTGPPPRPHGLALAGAGARFVARLVDVLAVLALCAMANAWFAYEWWQAFAPYLSAVAEYQTQGGEMPEAPEAVSNLFIMMCVVATAVWFAYEVPGSANSGQTVGKRLMGIKVVRVESGERLGFGRSFRRWGRLGLPTLLWPCFGVGLLLQVLDCLFVVIDRPLRQALHDKAAATVVVQVGRTRGRDANRLDAPSGGGHVDQS